jgi:hypothetical protein
MAKDTGIHFYKVVINGVTLRKGFMGQQGKHEAEAMAERWQGSHSQGKGLLKHKDRGDYVEVKRDYEGEKDYAERIDVAQRGNPQRIVMEYDSVYTP